MICELRTLKRFLYKYHYFGQAKVVDELIELLESDNPEFSERINSANMWGGSGAVWEVQLNHPDISEEEAKTDIISFRKAIIKLVKKMQAKGICSSLAENRASIFSEWSFGSRTDVS